MKYNIVIDNLFKDQTSGSLTEVVGAVDYKIYVTGSKSDGSTHYIETGLTANLRSVASSSFVSYNDLTENTVKAWITGSDNWSNCLVTAENNASHSLGLENVQSTNGLPW